MRPERDYQPKLIARIRLRLPGCMILKNDEHYIQGIPDLTVFFGPRYAILEVKKSQREPYRPNQEIYLAQFERMGAYSATVYPENEEEVLRGLEQALRPRRKAQLPKSQ